MKIERNKEGFEPITITVDTPEEALALWHRMNPGTGVFGRELVNVEHKTGQSDTPFDENMDAEVSTAIWNAVEVALGREVYDDNSL